MNGWFPAINARGEIASGSGEIFVGDQSFGTGWRPQWIDDSRIVYAGEVNTVLLNVRTGTRRIIEPVFNIYAAGGGTWAGIVQAGTSLVRLHRDTAMIGEWHGFGVPVMDDAGSLGLPTDYQSLTHTVIVNGEMLYTGQTMNLSLCRSALAMQVATSVYGRAVLGVRRPGNVVEDWTLYDWEDPVVCDGPDGPWVLSVTQHDLVLRPAGQHLGYRFDGEWLSPAIRFVDGVFIIVASTSRGVRIQTTVDPTRPRVDLLTQTDPQPPARPSCTITTYPTTVTVGAQAIVHASYGGGPATRATWLLGAAGVPTAVSVQSPPQTSFDYGPHLSSAGDYQIGLKVDGPGGADATGAPRVITVTDPHTEPEPEPMPDRLQIAFGPNLGSLDFAQLFTESNLWQFGWDRISAFQFYQGHFGLTGRDFGERFCGPNTFDVLVEAQAFKKLEATNVLIEVQVAGSSLDTIDQIVDKLFALDPPCTLDAVCYDHAFQELSGPDFAREVKTAREKHGLIVGAYMAYPMASVEHLSERLRVWDEYGGRPDFIRMDIDYNQRETYTAAIHRAIRALLEPRGMSLQVTINAKEHISDAEWVKQGKVWFDRAHEFGFDAYMIQSWASTPSDEDRQLPHNLIESDTSSHTHLLRYCMEQM